ncbi:hypothetical protein JXR74_03720 [Candidatus Mcinerneyibacteriota bacterium]|nr:hypothetical protein [Candidatus Mcinerneyibacteriota bacterium]
MNYFSINLYPQGEKNRQRRVIIRQMDIIHRVLLISALFLTAVYLYFIINSLSIKSKINRELDSLKAVAADQRLTTQEKDNILFMLSKEKHEVVMGSFLRVVNKYLIRNMYVTGIQFKRLPFELHFSLELKSSGVSRYKVNDIEAMIDNIINDKEYKLKITDVAVQEMNIQKGNLLNVTINGKVRIFE